MLSREHDPGLTCLGCPNLGCPNLELGVPKACTFLEFLAIISLETRKGVRRLHAEQAMTEGPGSRYVVTAQAACSGTAGTMTWPPTTCLYEAAASQPRWPFFGLASPAAKPRTNTHRAGQRGM